MLQQHFNCYAESIQVYIHQSVTIIRFKNTHYLISILHMYRFTIIAYSNNVIEKKKKKEKNCREHNNGSVRKIVVILIKTLRE